MAVERSDVDTKAVKECGLPVLWILGGPGSGKSTQCMMLSKVREMINISPEELIKTEAESPTPRGHQISQLIAGGSWKSLDTAIIVDIIAEAMVYQLANWFGNPEGKSKGFLIDGFPNSVSQAQEFMSRIVPVTKIVYISLDPNTLMERMLLKGSTDLDAAQEASGTFQKEMMPVIEKYKDKVIQVDGSEMSFLVTADINAALMNFKL